MAATTPCILCKKKREGRFVRPLTSPATALPAWHCFKCLPQGQGKGEDAAPAVATAGRVSLTQPSRDEGMALITPLKADIQALTVIESDEQYQMADALFGRVKQARKQWKLRMYGTATKPGPIPLIRRGLDDLYQLNRDVDGPLAQLEAAIEQPMKQFMLAKFREQQEQERAKREAEEEAERTLQALLAKQDALKTPAAKERIQEQINEAEQSYIDVVSQPVEDLPAAISSTAKAKKVPRVVDLSAFIKGIVSGDVPEDCVTVVASKLRDYFKEDPEAVAAMPGVVIEDDIQISGRG